MKKETNLPPAPEEVLAEYYQTFYQNRLRDGKLVPGEGVLKLRAKLWRRFLRLSGVASGFPSGTVPPEIVREVKE